MPDIISHHQVLIYQHVSSHLDTLQRHLAVAARAAPDRPVSPVMALAVSRLLRSVYRLLSREPGSRRLPRLNARERPRPAELAPLLADTRLALDTFAHTHRDWRNLLDGSWLTREAFLEAAADDE